MEPAEERVERPLLSSCRMHKRIVENLLNSPEACDVRVMRTTPPKPRPDGGARQSLPAPNNDLEVELALQRAELLERAHALPAIWLT